ncbi:MULTISPECIES: histidine phosphatase family protein [Brevibacterium]|uniref:Phosphoglycerate mutase n=1 Tax=Brevibacterium luteolum TaxID=199591 RepID=A0A2N6PKP0_9MICO|nr:MULTISPECIES: histidine phosphatase family protein [Brevibacterium]MBM7528664.1 2,3-bisphosphoglycerate-dependent phosphoglycerate mutase [Brevibacterium luteolum]MCT1829316.1 histidine phosphatase family protein [Brevibacterium luteolum]MCT1873245.1 histidine phosphatase family protein [Brevibacterium luteolum]MCT1890364.1 histidine phosphatase family protein [Brevibacterium luteolum]MCT1893211.1 histidine phosphatase family protein [Brevibacterium luteolum]
MVHLVLIRHGESDANAAGLLAGRTPGVALTEAGRAQIRSLAGILPFATITALRHSPLMRCVQTTEELLGIITVGQTREDPGLAEVDYGQWSGQPLTSLKEHPEWARVAESPSTMVFPGGESLQAAASRGIAAAEALVAELRQRTVASGEDEKTQEDSVGIIVSHGDIIKAILADALGSPLDRFQRIAVAPGSFSVISYPATGHPVVTAMSVTAGGRQAAPDLGGGR